MRPGPAASPKRQEIVSAPGKPMAIAGSLTGKPGEKTHLNSPVPHMQDGEYPLAFKTTNIKMDKWKENEKCNDQRLPGRTVVQAWNLPAYGKERQLLDLVA